MSGAVNHVGRVRALYKAILKLHRALPLQLQAIGDQYVKEEFRRHKNANSTEADAFMTEWTKYYVTIAKQVGAKKPKKVVGENLSPEFLDNLTEEQLGQLHELLQEIQKPAGER